MMAAGDTLRRAKIQDVMRTQSKSRADVERARLALDRCVLAARESVSSHLDIGGGQHLAEDSESLHGAGRHVAAAVAQQLDNSGANAGLQNGQVKKVHARRVECSMFEGVEGFG